MTDTPSPNDTTADSTVTLEVARGESGSGRTRFEVPVLSAHARVLDALNWVREHEDPTLGFRYACRVGMCGSCAIVVNGKEALACQMTIGEIEDTTIRVEPLRGLPVQHDLIVDMRPFFAGLARAEAALRPRDPGRRDLSVMPPASNERTTIEAQNGCITCGACTSAIADEARNEDDVGPAALNRLLMLALEERDSAGNARLAGIAGEVQALSAEAIARAESVCPANIPLASALEQLKSLIADHDRGG